MTVLVRQKNPQIRIVARCTDLKFADKLKRAGANSTVSPNRIGGLRLASEILRPHAVSFLDQMLKEHARTLRIEEVQVDAPSWTGGKQLQQLQLKQKYNLLLLAVKDQGSTYFANPPEDLALQPGTVLIVMGEMDDIRRARGRRRAGTSPYGDQLAAAHEQLVLPHRTGRTLAVGERSLQRSQCGS